MAGPGTGTGIGGTPRDPKQDVRTRRALGKIGGTSLAIDNITITINNDGQLQVGFGFPLGVPEGGTGVSSFDPYVVIVGGVTPTSPLQQAPGVGNKFQVLQSFGPGMVPEMYDRGVVPGVMAVWAGPGLPPGWLLCDGASYSTAAQPDLFAAIGYNYGGSGGFFNVPNLVGHNP